MKKILFLTLLAVCAWGTAEAQLRLNGYANYTFDDSFDTYYGNSGSYFGGKIQGGLQWGVGLEYLANPQYGIELIYYRQDTEAPVFYYTSSVIGEVQRNIELGVNYIMVGGVRYQKVNEVVEPYGGLMLGMAIFNNKEPQGNEETSATKFAWGLRLGSNIWVSDRIGLKVQAHLQSAVQAFGGSFYFGTGGAGAGVSTYSSILAFSLGGGVAIKLNSGE